MTAAEFNRADAQVICLVNGKEARRRQNTRRQRQAKAAEERRLKQLLAADKALRVLVLVLWAVICIAMVAAIVIPLVPDKGMGIPALIGLVVAVHAGATILDRHRRGAL